MVNDERLRQSPETRYLSRSPADARRLRDSVARVEAGGFERRDLTPDDCSERRRALDDMAAEGEEDGLYDATLDPPAVLERRER